MSKSGSRRLETFFDRSLFQGRRRALQHRWVLLTQTPEEGWRWAALPYTRVHPPQGGRRPSGRPH